MHKTYYIQNDDNLDSISKKLNQPKDRIRLYHNAHCDIEELIGKNIGPNNSMILYSDQQQETVNTSSDNEIPFSSDKEGYFSFIDIKLLEQELKYGYFLRMISEDNKENTLKEEFSIKFLNREADKIILRINKTTSSHINNYQGSSLIENISEEIVKCLYPIQISINKTGSFMDILNLEEIQNKWKNSKTEILNFFKNDYTEVYLNMSEAVLYNKELLITKLNKSFFLRIFFNDIYTTYSENYSSKKTVKFPLIYNEDDLEYEIVQRINPKKDEYELISIDMEGKINDEKDQGKYYAKYFIDAKDHTINNLIFKCNSTRATKEIEVIISKI